MMPFPFYFLLPCFYAHMHKCYALMHSQSVINPRRTCAARVTVVGSVCVCVSVAQHLTYRMFIRPTNDTTYLTGNEDQNIYGVFSENSPLQS